MYELALYGSSTLILILFVGIAYVFGGYLK
jgi:hypothetical protein